MSADPRASRVAVVADSLFVARLDELRDAGWGVIQLPPATIEPTIAREWIAQAAEQVAEYQRTGYAVSLLDDGAWAEELGEHGLATLPVFPAPT